MASRRSDAGIGSDGKTSTTEVSAERSSFVAIVEGRGQARGEVGIAALDLYATRLILCQFSDSQNYTKVLSKLNVLRPSEILMPSTICDVSGQASRLCQQIQKEFPEVLVAPLQRRLFNEVLGIQKLQQICLDQDSSVIYTVTQKYYALAATAALIKYIEIVRSVIFPAKVMKVEFQLSEKTVIIDRPTTQHLELLNNKLVINSAQSLFGILNSCRTPGGVRCLRSNILQPSCDPEFIHRRLDCIQELRNNPVMLYDIMNLLHQLPQDLEHVIATLIQIPKVDSIRVTEQRINYVIFLKQTLTALPGFVQVLENAEHPYFHSIREDFASPSFEQLLEKIQIVIAGDARVTKGAIAMRAQRCFAVNTNINPLLDVARKALIEIQEDTNKYVMELGRDHQLNLRLLENNSRGFYAQLMLPTRNIELPSLPDTFLNVARKKNIVTFTTEPLLLAEQRVKKILEEIQNISSLIVAELLTNIRMDIGILYKVSDAISELDVLYSLTTYSISTARICRPEFSSRLMSISMARHPILDAISALPIIANDLFMSNDTNVAIITGPNMSGKTTFLKQIALLQVLAQIGSFVPADSATFKIVNQIFSRLGNADNIEANASSFALEMNEMNYIISNNNDQSLIIIDELGRSTSTEEGASLCWAMLEDLMHHKSCVLFSTHYLFLTKLESLYINVLNYKLETVELVEQFEHSNAENRSSTGEESVFTPLTSNAKLNYTHVLKRGVTDVENYGLKLAKDSYPASVLQRAGVIAKEIENSQKRGVGLAATDEKGNPLGVKRSKCLLATHLYYLSQSGIAERLSCHEIRNYLHNLQEECCRFW